MIKQFKYGTLPIVAMGSALATVAFAKTPPPKVPELHEVVVSGVRESLQTAQAIKRKSIMVEDAIVAQDIGKFPDNSTAGALQRVTGVQIKRDADEATTVLIRGLPDVVTLLNGRDIFTTTGHFVALADIPAALLQRVAVYKSNAPSLVAGGIAGTIDVRLHRPFDFPGFVMAGSAQARYEGNSGKVDPLGSFLVSDRWNTSLGQFGALAAVSYQQQRYLENRIFDFLQIVGPGGNSMPLTVGGIANPGNRKRPAANYSLQWRPAPGVQLYLEGFYTEYRNTYSDDFFIGIPIASAPQSYTLFPGTSVIHTYTGANAYTLTSTQAYKNHSETWQNAIGGKFALGALTLSTDLALTHSLDSGRYVILDTQFNAPTLSANFNYNGTGTPRLAISGVNLLDGSNFYLAHLFHNRNNDVGRALAWRLDGSYAFASGLITSVKSGVRVYHRTASSKSGSGNQIFYPAGSPPTAASSVPGLSSLSPGNFFNGRMGVSQWFEGNPAFLLNNTNTLLTLFGQPTGPAPYDPTNFFNDTENTYAFYGEANFSTMLGSHRLEGLIGGRLVHTNEKLGAYEETTIGGVAGPPTFVTINNSHTEFLPSLNTRLTLKHDLYLRFTASRSITRPTFAALNPSVTLNTPGPTLLGAGAGGNPNLGNITSNNFNLAMEWYFARVGSLTGTLFYRQINGYIQTYAENEVVNGINYNVSRPRNTGSGGLYGAEVAYQQFFKFVPEWLRGIGTQLNYTYIDAHTESPPLNPTTLEPTGNNTGIRIQQPLVNVSRNSFNVVAMYERHRVSLTLAYNWRSSFVDSYNNGAGLLEPPTVYVKPIGDLDFSGSYKLTRHIMLTLEARNLLNYTRHSYFGNSYLFPQDTRRYDRTIVVGFRARF